MIFRKLSWGIILESDLKLTLKFELRTLRKKNISASDLYHRRKGSTGLLTAKSYMKRYMLSSRNGGGHLPKLTRSWVESHGWSYLRCSTRVENEARQGST